MTKDALFNSSRFMNLCRKEMVESWRTNLLLIVMMFGIMLIMFLISSYVTYDDWFAKSTTDPMVIPTLNIFLTLGWIFGCMFASVTFKHMKSKTGRLSTLMTPATPFEKFFSRWLISTLVYLLVFIIVFMLADYMRVLIFRVIHPDLTIVPACLKYLAADSGPYIMGREFMGMSDVILLYLFTQSFFLLGSIVWPRNSFIKTFAAVLFIMVTYSLFFAGIITMLIDDNLYVSERDLLSFETMKIIGNGLLMLFTLFNWTLAYYRFKESEIINRL